jgi:RNA polymerase sigma-70 factor (ECF subfamily)
LLQQKSSLAPPRYVAASLRPAWELVLLTGGKSVPVPEPAASFDLEACRRGDRPALEAVFRAHAPAIARVLARLVGPSADVEDLLQDTFANAIGAFPQFRGEASVKTWLHRIAIHVAHGHLRRPRHRRETPLADEAVLGATETCAEDQELARRLYQHLEAIDAAKRIALVLRVIEGYSVEEIAALTGASRAAVRSRIFWARRALMKRMKRDPLFAGRQP